MAEIENSDHESPAETSARPKKGFRKGRWIFGLTLVLVTGLLIGPATYRSWKSKSASEIVAHAEKLINEGKAEEAFKLLSKGYSNDPQQPAYLRAIAQFLRKAGAEPDRSLHFWRQLSNTGNATFDDRMAMGENLIQSGDAGEARRIWQALSPEERTHRRAIELEAQLLQSEGQTAQAEALMRRALAMDPDNPESVLRLARMDMTNPFSEVQTQALATMWKLARGEGNESLVAIDALSNDSRLTGSQALELLELLEKKPNPSDRLRYQILSAYVRLNPQDRNAMLGQEAKRQTGKPVDQMVDYFRWLYMIGEHDALLALMPKEKATKTREMFPIYIEVLAAKQQWKEIQEILRTAATLPASPTDLALLRARCAQALNEPIGTVKGHLQEACRAALASRDMNTFNRTTTITEKLGFVDVAIDAFRSASALPQYKLAMLERILALQTQQQKTNAVLSTMEDIIAAKPDATAYQERALYLKLLVGSEIETAGDEAEKLSKAGLLKETPREFLQALAAFRELDYAKVKEILEPVRPTDLSPGQRAVYAGMLSTCGDVARGFAIAEKLPRTLLLEEEARFLALAL